MCKLGFHISHGLGFYLSFGRTHLSDLVSMGWRAYVQTLSLCFWDLLDFMQVIFITSRQKSSMILVLRMNQQKVLQDLKVC